METSEMINVAKKYSDKIADKEDVFLFNLLELSIMINNKGEYNRLKAKIKKNARLYNEMAKLLLPLFDILQEPSNSNQVFNYNQKSDKLLRKEWIGYFPYWIYDSINEWISRKNEPVSSKDKSKLYDLLLLMERMKE